MPKLNKYYSAVQNKNYQTHPNQISKTQLQPKDHPQQQTYGPDQIQFDSQTITGSKKNKQKGRKLQNIHTQRQGQKKIAGFTTQEKDNNSSQNKKNCISRVKQIEWREKFPQYQWYKNMSKNKKIGFWIGISMFIAAIICGISLGIVLNGQDDGQLMKIQRGQVWQITLNGQNLIMAQALWSQQQHQAQVISVQNKKLQSVHLNTYSNTRQLLTQNNQQKYAFTIETLSLLSILSNYQKTKQTIPNWLLKYNQNPRQMIDKLITIIKTELTKPGTKKFNEFIPDNFILESVSEQILIEIKYDPLQQKFVLSLFKPDENHLQIDNQEINRKYHKKDNKKPNNKQAKEQTTNKNKNKNNLQTNQQNKKDKTLNEQDILTNAMKNTVHHIKRVAVRNIQAIKVKGQQLRAYQQHMVDQNKPLQEWQKVIINECKMIEMLRFRCKIEGAMKLIPQLSWEKIKDSSSNIVISQNLNMIFKEVKSQKQESKQGN